MAVPGSAITGSPGPAGVIADAGFGAKGGVGIAVLSLITMILGYGLLLALWYHVFRERPEEKAARRAREAALAAAGHPDESARRHNDDRVDAVRVHAGRVDADESSPRHGRPPRIEPRTRPRLRRR